MNNSLTSIEPKEIWAHFSSINSIPRASKKEQEISDFMISFGKELQEEYPEIGQSRSLLKQMNGIAYDTLSKVLLVTGKNWPYTFEIREGLPIGNDDRTMKTEVAACYPATIRKLDFNHVQLGLNNQLPFIPMPTNQEVREHFHG